MSDYSKVTNFLAKDSLASGDANKIVKGAEFETEFAAIQTAVGTKANKTVPGTANNVALLSSLGDLVDSTITQAKLNNVANTTSSTAELNILTGVTSTAAEINQLHGTTIVAGSTHKTTAQDHGTKATNYAIDLSTAQTHLVAFSAPATLTISSTFTNDKAIVVIKNGGNAITLAGIDTDSPTLTNAVSTQDFIGLVKSFGKITCVATVLNKVAV